MSADTASPDKLRTKLPVYLGWYGDSMDVLATEDGLEVDEFGIIPWEWILAAREAIVAAEQKVV